MGFEDWKNKELVRGEYKTWVEWRGEAYEAGAASRQAEIDCLKVELDAANERAMMLLNHKNKMVDKLQSEIDELQKRIDEALEAFEDGSFNYCQSILKGTTP